METNETSSAETERPDPLTRFMHPEHGELTVVGAEGRSKLCRHADGREFRIGSRVVNRLRSAAARPNPLLESPGTVERKIHADIVGMAGAELPDAVTTLLSEMSDGPDRLDLARRIAVAAEAFL